MPSARNIDRGKDASLEDAATTAFGKRLPNEEKMLGNGLASRWGRRGLPEACRDWETALDAR
jgi:hypothetical protein